ncbi:unnamed protein product, partial [Meganyctiphanes norvegica]
IICRDHESAKDPDGYTIGSAGFWHRFYLLVMVSVFWVTDLLAWVVPPKEIWLPTGILNNLQGVLVFFVFLTHRTKRAALKEQLPKLLKVSNMMINNVDNAQMNINRQNEFLSENLSPSWTKRKGTASLLEVDSNDPSTSADSTGITLISLTRKDSNLLVPNILPETSLSNISKHPTLSHTNQSISSQDHQQNADNVHNLQQAVPDSSTTNDAYLSEEDGNQ